LWTHPGPPYVTASNLCNKVRFGWLTKPGASHAGANPEAGSELQGGATAVGTYHYPGAECAHLRMPPPPPSPSPSPPPSPPPPPSAPPSAVLIAQDHYCSNRICSTGCAGSTLLPQGARTPADCMAYVRSIAPPDQFNSTIVKEFGTNPSACRPDASLLASLRSVHGAEATFLASSRTMVINKNICSNPRTRVRSTAAVREVHTRSNLVLLDAELQPLGEYPLRPFGQQSAQNYKLPFQPEDVRLLGARSQTLITFTTPPWWRAKAAYHFVGRLSFDPERREFQVAEVKPLASERNAGLVLLPEPDGAALPALMGRPSFIEMTSVSPPTFRRADGSSCVAEDRLPSAFDTRQAHHLHNSINPLWLPRLNGYLVMMHRHYRYGGARFYFGSGYRHIFLLTDRAFRVLRFSRELCFDAILRGGGRGGGRVEHEHEGATEPCDSIQYVMSAIQSRDELVLSLGVDDCYGALVRLPLRRLDDLLEFTGDATASITSASASASASSAFLPLRHPPHCGMRLLDAHPHDAGLLRQSIGWLRAKMAWGSPAYAQRPAATMTRDFRSLPTALLAYGQKAFGSAAELDATLRATPPPETFNWRCSPWRQVRFLLVAPPRDNSLKRLRGEYAQPGGADPYGVCRLPHRQSPPPFVIDVGANLGDVTIAVTKLHPTATVLAIEPAPLTFFYLLWNLHLNGIDLDLPYNASPVALRSDQPLREWIRQQRHEPRQQRHEPRQHNLEGSTRVLPLQRVAEAQDATMYQGESDLLNAVGLSEEEEKRHGDPRGRLGIGHFGSMPTSWRATRVRALNLPRLLQECNRVVDMLKVDCEGCEYRLLPQLDQLGWLKRNRVRLLGGELHQKWQPSRFSEAQLNATAAALHERACASTALLGSGSSRGGTVSGDTPSASTGTGGAKGRAKQASETFRC
jgi:FkbM family methyltransferase